MQPKNITPREQKKCIEQSLKKFKELRRNLGPDASVEQKRYLDEKKRWAVWFSTAERPTNTCRRFP